MELLINLVRFIIILGVLIFIHELGHFMVAKKVGIYVFRFSIGFGKRLIGFRIKETDYCLSLIPFGGYVKMAGQEDMPNSDSDEKVDDDAEDEVNVPEDQKFYNKTVWQRFAVVVAGPLMNFLLGLVIFIVVYAYGMNVPAYMRSTTVGEIVEGSPAMEAGLQPGDTILSIDGEPIEDWKSITRKTIFSIDKELTFDVKRGEEVVSLKITPGYYDQKSNPGIGVLPYIKPIIKDVIEDSPASTAGLQANDVILSVNGQSSSFTNIIQHVKYAEGGKLTLSVLRNDEQQQVTLTPDTIGILPGLETAANVIISVDEEKYPHLAPGDVIVDIDGTEVQAETDLGDLLTGKINQTAEITAQRTSGLLFFKQTKVISFSQVVGEGNKIGVYFEPDSATALEKYPVPVAIAKGSKRAFASVGELFASMYYLVIGKIKARELAGPVGIYKITADFAKSGFMIFTVIL